MGKRHVGNMQKELRLPLGRHKHRWKDNIKIEQQEMGWGHGLD
jgi:hypothetical protein